jgi:hypothetical protein
MATTSAERMRRKREKDFATAWGPGDDLSGISLSGLLDLIGKESRACHRDNQRGRAMLAAFITELGQRLEINVEASYSRGRY